MKVSSLLLSAFLALASGHYVHEETEIRHEEPSENHVRSHHKEENQGPRVHHKYPDEAGPRVHHQNEGPRPKQENQGPRVHHKYPDEGGAPRVHHQNEGPPRPKQEETTKQNLRQGGNPQHTRPRSTQTVDVVIVGSGMAGISAAFDLKKEKKSVKILEAKERHGGRIYKDTAKFGMPIDIGAEWVHLEAATRDNVEGGFTDTTTLLSAITGTTPKLATIPDPADICTWSEATGNIETDSESEDWRWKDSTWYDFMRTEMIDSTPNGVKGDIMLNCPVTKIEYGTAEEGATVTCKSTITGTEHKFEASMVIVTVPMSILSSSLNKETPKLVGSIEFDPPLHDSNYATQAKLFKMGPGIKVWLGGFKETMWEGLQAIKDVQTNNNIENGNSADTWGQRVYFDEMWGHPSLQGSQHVIAMFAHGTGTKDFYMADKAADDPSDKDLIEKILKELEEIYPDEDIMEKYNEDKDSYVKNNCFIQRWAREPYIETGYTQYAPKAAMEQFQEPVNDVVYFAGEAIPPDANDWGFAHAAAQSGKKAAYYIIKDLKEQRRRE